MKLDCVPKDFVRRRFVLAIFAIRSERSEIAYSRFSAINFISQQRSNAEQNPLVHTFIIPQTIPLPSYSFNRLNCTLHRNRQFKTRDTYNNTSPYMHCKFCPKIKKNIYCKYMHVNCSCLSILQCIRSLRLRNIISSNQSDLTTRALRAHRAASCRSNFVRDKVGLRPTTSRPTDAWV